MSMDKLNKPSNNPTNPTKEDKFDISQIPAEFIKAIAKQEGTTFKPRTLYSG